MTILRLSTVGLNIRNFSAAPIRLFLGPPAFTSKCHRPTGKTSAMY